MLAKLKARFTTDVTIEIQAGENLEGQALFEAMKKMRSSLLEEIPRDVPVQTNEQPAQDNDAIFGKKFKGNDFDYFF